MSLTVLQLTNNLKSGAIPHTIVDISRNFSEDIDILAGGLQAGNEERVNSKVLQELRDAEVTPIQFKFDSQSFISAGQELYDVLTDIDVLHTHLVRSGVIGRVLGTIAGTPFIVSTEQSVHTGRQYNLKQRLLNNATLPLADHVIPISSTVENSFGRWIRTSIPSERRTVIHNPVNQDLVLSFRNRPLPDSVETFVSESSPIIGSVGRLASVKNHELLLNAAASLCRKYPNLGIVLVGDGPLEESLREQARDLGIDNSVLFTGRIERSKVYTLLHEFNVFAIPSIHEGQGIALCEAMAAGTPIVASDIMTFREVLGKTGRLVPLDEEKWTTAIDSAIEDDYNPDLLQQRAYKKFSPCKIASLYEKIYRQGLSYDSKSR